MVITVHFCLYFAWQFNIRSFAKVTSATERVTNIINKDFRHCERSKAILQEIL